MRIQGIYRSRGRGLRHIHQTQSMTGINPNPGWRLTAELKRKIDRYAEFPATGVSLRQMVQFGGNPSDGMLFRASQFIVEELPIRLAHRVEDLDSLPYNLSTMPSIQRVKSWYAQSFDELTSLEKPVLSSELKDKLYRPALREKKIMQMRDFGIKSEPPNYSGVSRLDPLSACSSQRSYYSPVDPDYQWPLEIQRYNRIITERLQKIKARHDGVVATVAQGVVEWKQSPYFVPNSEEVQMFLDRFYMSRIGIRMLIGQHIALNMDRGIRDDFVGIICTDTNVKDITQTAIDNARFICEDWYGLFEAPKVILHSNAENINFVYVPGHLAHMIFEVVKNSLRAVVDTYGADYEDFPPVKVVIAQGDEDITVKISDEGGGIPRRAVEKAWTYMYTTAKDIPTLEPDGRSDFKAPMAGFGYGLPISRLYARYFGGDLHLISMEGYGTDVYLHLNRLSTGSEPLVG